jgi:hypothetical protein
MGKRPAETRARVPSKPTISYTVAPYNFGSFSVGRFGRGSSADVFSVEVLSVGKPNSIAEARSLAFLRQ